MADALTDTLLLAVADYATPGEALANALGTAFAPLNERQFPDGESLVTLPAALPERVLVYCSLDHPNERLLPLLLALHGLRDAGVAWIGLVTPYLAYMRQDAAFNRGEVISQRIIAPLIAAPIDALWTVDPHLHRIASLDAVFPNISARALTAAPLLATWLASETRETRDTLLIGPDLESEQWVSNIARRCERPWGVARKNRLGDREVQVELPDIAIRGKHCVLIDDVASTGRTLAVATTQLLDAGASSVDVLVTHALFVGDAEDVLHHAGVNRIISTDSVHHSSNRLTLALLLADAIRKDAAGQPGP
jgi:ribose-phosphate pyrophosphokinase